MSKYSLVFLCLFFLACTERRQERLLFSADERLSQERYTEAAEQLKRVVAINPESKLALRAIYKLGFTLETYLKDFEGALFNYQEFVRLSTDRVSIYEVQKRIANIYFEQLHDPDKAISAYKKLIAFSPESLELDLFQFRIAQSYFQQNNFEQARYEFQQLIERFPKSQYSARARFEVGNSYYMEGRYDIGVEALKQVVRNHPQSEFATEAEFLMAQCFEHQQKPESALLAYENIKGRYASPEILDLRIKELSQRLKNKR